MMFWLGLLNFLVLQWFFVRLARVYDDNDDPVGWTWLTGAVPLTGWCTAYWIIKGHGCADSDEACDTSCYADAGSRRRFVCGKRCSGASREDTDDR